MKKKILNISVFLLYLLYEIIFIDILTIFNINYFKFDISFKVILLFGINSLFLLFLIFFYRKELKVDLNDYKKNYKEYIRKYILIYMCGVILMGLTNIILIKFVNLKISGNESSIRELIKKVPLYMTFSTIIYAPFVEEMIFRKSIRNVVNNKYIYIIASGFIFGILHISDLYNIKEILMGIPYIIMGIDFAYIYYKSNNIFTTITFHMIHNLLLLLMQLI